MDTKTAAALEETIAHWKRNVEAAMPSGVNIGVAKCALCSMFWPDLLLPGCLGCPVMIKSGAPQCGSTPYDFAKTRLFQWADRPHRLELRQAFRAAAHAELAFLESLREPIEDTP